MDMRKVGKWIGDIHRRQHRYLCEHLRFLGLTSGLLSFYMTIKNNKGISQKLLSQKLSMDKTTTAKAVKQLELLGYVRRDRNESDRRCYRLFLTDQGRSIAGKVRGVFRKMDALYISKLSSQELVQLEGMLHKMGLALAEHEQKDK